MGVTIVLEKARCRFMGNLMMDIDDAVTVYILNVGLIQDRVTIPINMLDYYLELLKAVDSKQKAFQVALLMFKQLKVGDVIVFDNGRRGKIQPPSTGHLNNCYKLIKKDGSLGVKELTLYGKTENYNYYAENREFIDYKKIMN